MALANPRLIFLPRLLSLINHIKISKRGEILKKPECLRRILKKNVNKNDILMIKGSNATGLFKISQSLKKGKINAL